MKRPPGLTPNEHRDLAGELALLDSYLQRRHLQIANRLGLNCKAGRLAARAHAAVRQLRFSLQAELRAPLYVSRTPPPELELRQAADRLLLPAVEAARGAQAE